MIIYTGRFQPFHNGHLSLIKTLRSSFPTEIICIAVIKDVPLQNKKDEFDELVDQQLRVSKNPFSSDVVLKLIDEVLQQEKLYNVVTTLMPRASKETWQIINALFDCKRIWAFTHNSLQPDEWEEKKAEFYSSMGESIIRIPIKKEINGTDIRASMNNCDYAILASLVPSPILNFLIENNKKDGK